MFVERQEPTQVEHLTGAPLLGRLLVLPTNNTLGWKGMQVANTLAYSEILSLAAEKKFYNIGQWFILFLNILRLILCSKVINELF